VNREKCDTFCNKVEDEVEGESKSTGG